MDMENKNNIFKKSLNLHARGLTASLGLHNPETVQEKLQCLPQAPICIGLVFSGIHLTGKALIFLRGAGINISIKF